MLSCELKTFQAKVRRGLTISGQILICETKYKCHGDSHSYHTQNQQERSSWNFTQIFLLLGEAQPQFAVRFNDTLLFSHILSIMNSISIKRLIVIELEGPVACCWFHDLNQWIAKSFWSDISWYLDKVDKIIDTLSQMIVYSCITSGFCFCKKQDVMQLVGYLWISGNSLGLKVPDAMPSKLLSMHFTYYIDIIICLKA